MPFADPEVYRLYQRDYRHKFKQEKSDADKRYYYLHREIIREFYNYHDPNREQRLEYNRRWRRNKLKENPNFYKENNYKYREQQKQCRLRKKLRTQ